MKAVCHICEKELIPKAPGSIVLDGFIDQDTGEFCHLRKRCREKHYHNKQGNNPGTTYSEFPVTLQNLPILLRKLNSSKNVKSTRKKQV
jgi:hypothetical protein